jgi:hypothetical protein
VIAYVDIVVDRLLRDEEGGNALAATADISALKNAIEIPRY